LVGGVRNVLLWKTITHTVVLLALLVGFITILFEPDAIVLEGSVILPRWIGWFGWSLASLSSLGFIVLDWVAFFEANTGDGK
jgi:hypothetical protein